MPVVGRRDADDVDFAVRQLPYGVWTTEAGEVPNSARGASTEAFGSRSGPGGDGGKLHVDESKIAAIDPGAVQLLEKRPVRLLKDHAEAGHAGTKTVMRKVGWRVHLPMISPSLPD